MDDACYCNATMGKQFARLGETEVRNGRRSMSKLDGFAPEAIMQM